VSFLHQKILSARSAGLTSSPNPGPHERLGILLSWCFREVGPEGQEEVPGEAGRLGLTANRILDFGH
jgi:hypothetical protein